MHEASHGSSNQAVRIFYFFLMMARCQTQRIGRGLRDIWSVDSVFFFFHSVLSASLVSRSPPCDYDIIKVLFIDFLCFSSHCLISRQTLTPHPPSSCLSVVLCSWEDSSCFFSVLGKFIKQVRWWRFNLRKSSGPGRRKGDFYGRCWCFNNLRWVVRRQTREANCCFKWKRKLAEKNGGKLC